MSKLVDRNIYFDSVVLTQLISLQFHPKRYHWGLTHWQHRRTQTSIVVGHTLLSNTQASYTPPGQYQGPIRQSTRGTSFASLRDSDDEDTAVDYPIEPAFTQDSLASLNATYRSEYRRVVDGFGARTTVMQG